MNIGTTIGCDIPYSQELNVLYGIIKLGRTSAYDSLLLIHA